MARALVAVALFVCSPFALAQTQPLPPEKLSVAGDSLSQGALADGTWPGDQPWNSWAFGTTQVVNSVLLRYRTYVNPLMTAQPESEDGAKMLADFTNQVTAICNQWPKPNRVFVALGQNDACYSKRASWWQSAATYMPSASTFATALHAGLAQLESCLPYGSVVQVVSVIRVDFLYDAGISKDSVYCPLAWYTLDICPIVTHEPYRWRRDQIGARIDAWNAALAQEVASFDTDGVNPGVRFVTDWEGSRSAGHANTSAGTYKFGARDINALDCFHASTTGQRKLACAESAKSLDAGAISTVAEPSDCFLQ